jgi:hypothetical protein
VVRKTPIWWLTFIVIVCLASVPAIIIANKLAVNHLANFFIYIVCYLAIALPLGKNFNKWHTWKIK